MLLYLFSVIWGINYKDLKLEDSLHLLKTSWDIFQKYKVRLLDETKEASNEYKGAVMIFGYQYVLRLLLEWGDQEILEEIDKIFKEILSRIRKWILIGEAKRVTLDTYYTTLAGLLSVASRIALELNVFIAETPNLIKSLFSEELENLWSYSKYLYTTLYLNLLDTIANTSTFIEIETVRKSILRQISHEYERVINQAKDTPIIYNIETPNAIRINAMLGEEENKNKAYSLLENLRDEAPNFTVKLSEKILDKFTKVEKISSKEK